MRPKSFLDANCPQGLRLELQFPSCWDGKSLDSPDHKSHILYPNLMKTGTCPPGYDVRTPVLFYETIWDTYQFVNDSGQFVLSYGDTTGYGYHGDFMSGWNQTFLQNAVNTCTNESGNQADCPLFTLQDDSIATSCKLTVPDSLKDEDVTGPMATLPGNVAIQDGPGYATIGPMGPPSSSPGVNSTWAATFILSQPLSSNTTDVVPNPAITPPPPPPNTFASPVENMGDGTTTASFISDGTSVIMVIVEEMVTVTETATMTVAGAKRHAHQHKHIQGGHRL